MIDIEKLKLDTWGEIKNCGDFLDTIDFINTQTSKITDDFLQAKENKLKESASFIGTLAECQDNDKKVKEEIKSLERVYQTKSTEFFDSLIKKWIKDYIDEGNNYSEKEFDLLYDYAYSEGHSYGWYEVLNQIETISELYDNLLEARGK